MGIGTAFVAAIVGAAIGAAVSCLVLWRQERAARREASDATNRVRRSEALLQALVRNSHDVIAVFDRRGTCTFASPSAARGFGRPLERLVGGPPFDFVHPDDRSRVIEVLLGIPWEPGSASPPVEFRVVHEDGTWHTVEAVGTHLAHDASGVEGVVVNARDVTERRWAEAELREAQERFRSAFDYAPIGMALAGVDGELFRVNRALTRMLGRAEDELLGVSILELTHPDDQASIRAHIDKLILGEIPSYQIEQRYLHNDGREVWTAISASLVRDSAGAPMYVVHQMEDITARRRDGERLAHQAIHDPLTGLPNRLLFVDRLRRALAEDTNGATAVLFLDLDHFKVINDSLGHSAGDRLLVTIADRLRNAVRPDDTVARFGGDEFTVLCRGVPDARAATEITDRIATAVAKPVHLSEGEVYVTVSAGIALSGGDMETPETLLRNADAAMYRAKERGRARFEVYAAGSRDNAVTHLRTGNELHRALERGELRVFYQPIIKLETSRISGFEALVRWEHPERGLVGPDHFIPLAEETGLVVPLGSWVLEQACRQAAHWQADGATVSISVNLSPRQLAEPTLPETVAGVIGRTGVDPARVWLEITESTLMRDAESAISVLHALRDLGVHLAVDDFGTGYSSMTYLKRFPVDSLKVDRSFVDGLGRESGATAICTAVVGLAHALGMGAVAEGVETSAQLAALRALGCEFAQGFLFGRPAPAERFAVRRGATAIETPRHASPAFETGAPASTPAGRVPVPEPASPVR